MKITQEIVTIIPRSDDTAVFVNEFIERRIKQGTVQKVELENNSIIVSEIVNFTIEEDE